jgi:DNA polymerase V
MEKLKETLSSYSQTFESHSNVEIFYFGDIQCGFPSPAADYIEKGLNLHDFVVKKPAATFFMRAKGDSMIDAGIYPNDLLVIDKSIAAKSGHVVVACLNGEMTLKRLSYHFDHPILIAENKKYKALTITKEMDFQVFGVLTCNLHLHTNL